MFHSFLSIAPLHQLPNKNILQREGLGGVQGQECGGRGVFWGSVGDNVLVAHSRSFVIPENLFPVNILSP